jgi:hypothetical protein
MAYIPPVLPSTFFCSTLKHVDTTALYILNPRFLSEEDIDR